MAQSSGDLGSLHLLYSSNHSDSILKCHDREFKVHRAILEHESVFFLTLYAGPWKENADGQVNLDATEPAILEQALRFFYARSWDVIQQPEEGALLFNIKLYVFGDAYMAERLKEQAFKKCQSLLVESICLEELSDVVELTFSNTKRTDQALRAEVLHLCAKKLDPADIKQEEPSDPTDSKPTTAGMTLTNPLSSAFVVTSSSSTDGDEKKRKAKRRKREIDEKTQRKEELLADLVARLEAEEPVAWHLQTRSAAAARKQKELMLASVQERARLEEKVQKLQAETNEADRASALLKSHTRCRNKSCGAELTKYQYTASGRVRALRCAQCNCKHSQTAT